MNWAAWDHPVLRLGPQVRLGYYAQEHETLDPQRTVMGEMLQQRGMTRDHAFQLRSRFLFRWPELEQPVGSLSGGQKSRLQLAKLMAVDVNFLLVISHDRFFLDRIVERIVAVEDRSLQDPVGRGRGWRQAQMTNEAAE